MSVVVRNVERVERGVVEATLANAHLGSIELGPSYREVVPLALVLLLVALRPPREAVAELE